MKYDEGESGGIVAKIIELTETTDLTINKICKTVGIHKDTYFEWRNTRPDFSDQLKKAGSKRLEGMARIARKSAFRKIKGYSVKETKIVYESGLDKEGKRKVKERTVTTKHVQPSDTLIMYALNNTDPDNFKHKEHHDHTTKGERVDYRDWTLEEIKARAKALAEVKEGTDD